MNLEIRNEALQFHFWKYLFEFSAQCISQPVSSCKAEIQVQNKYASYKIQAGLSLCPNFFSMWAGGGGGAGRSFPNERQKRV